MKCGQVPKPSVVRSIDRCEFDGFVASTVRRLEGHRSKERRRRNSPGSMSNPDLVALRLSYPASCGIRNPIIRLASFTGSTTSVMVWPIAATSSKNPRLSAGVSC